MEMPEVRRRSYCRKSRTYIVYRRGNRRKVRYQIMAFEGYKQHRGRKKDYKCDDIYNPNAEGGLAWNDEDVAIKWPIENIKEEINPPNI